MNRGKHYLSPEDLADLMGTDNMNSAYKLHKTIREALKRCRNAGAGRCGQKCQCPPKRNLTILEYCRYVDDDYRHVYYMLRGEPPEYDPGQGPG
ncbi:MAG: hypothetical protein AAF998_23350 [Bacteroidota bacterium]